MARTPSMTKEEAERELGPRGSLVVTADNRKTVRKWLNAQGFPSLLTGSLAMAELALAYNDLSGRGIQAVRDKMANTAAFSDDAEADYDAVDRAEAGEFASDEAANDDFADAGHAKPATVEGKTQATQAAPRIPSSVDAAGKALADALAAIAAMQGSNQAPIDENAVRRIAEKVVSEKAITGEKLPKVFEEIAALVQQTVNDAMVSAAVRIEVKLPDADEFRNLEGIHHPQFARLLKAATSRQADGFHPNIWIAGPAGSGKTYAAKKVAEAMEAEFHYNGALSMPHELLGFIDAGGTYHETPFRHGYTRKAVYLFDEVDGSDNSALLALNAALANGRASFPNGQCERHADSVIIATANTWGLGANADYVGRAKIDAAFLSRFPVRIQWDYDTDMEKQICGNPQWAGKVQAARARARQAGIKVLIDPRATIAGAALIKAGFSENDAAEMTYLANLTPEQKQQITR